MHALEGNGNPLQCCCLENPRDRRAWWAAIYGDGHDWSDLAAVAAASYPVAGWGFPPAPAPFILFFKGCQENLPVAIGFLNIRCVWDLRLQCQPQILSWGQLSFTAPQALFIGGVGKHSRSGCTYRKCPRGGSTVTRSTLVSRATRALGNVCFLGCELEDCAWVNTQGLVSPCLFPLTLHSSPSESSLHHPQNPAEVPRRLHSQDRGLSWGPQPQSTCSLGYLSKFKARGSGDHPLVKRRTLVAARASLTVQVQEGAQLRAPCRAVQPYSWPVMDPRLFRLQGWDSSPGPGGGWKLD